MFPGLQRKNLWIILVVSQVIDEQPQSPVNMFSSAAKRKEETNAFGRTRGAKGQRKKGLRL
jgi:hypothetical protein